MPDLAECLRQIVGGVAVVFDDQETHDEPAVSWISDVPRRGTVLDCTNHSGTISKCPGVGPRGDRPCQREKCEGRRFDPPPLNQPRSEGQPYLQPYLLIAPLLSTRPPPRRFTPLSKPRSRSLQCAII